MIHNNQGKRCRKVQSVARLDPDRHPLVQRVAAMAAAGGEMAHDMTGPVGTEQCLSLAALLATRLSPLHIGGASVPGASAIHRLTGACCCSCRSGPDINSARLAMVCLQFLYSSIFGNKLLDLTFQLLYSCIPGSKCLQQGPHINRL